MPSVVTPPSPRFHGNIHIEANKEDAVNIANSLSSYPSTDYYIHINLFCDCSRSKIDDLDGSQDPDDGGIAVAFRPWLPRVQNDTIAIEAWPVKPMFHHVLGEFIALSQGLVVAFQQLTQFAGSLAGRTVIVRLFNDNKYNLQYLQGRRYLEPQMLALTRPVLDLIADQTRALHSLGTPVILEAHWIPGHYHQVKPHIDADVYSRSARIRQRSFSTLTGDNWQEANQPYVVSTLGHRLTLAALDAARFMPELMNLIPLQHRPVQHQPVNNPTAAPAQVEEHQAINADVNSLNEPTPARPSQPGEKTTSPLGNPAEANLAAASDEGKPEDNNEDTSKDAKAVSSQEDKENAGEEAASKTAHSEDSTDSTEETVKKDVQAGEEKARKIAHSEDRAEETSEKDMQASKKRHHEADDAQPSLASSMPKAARNPEPSASLAEQGECPRPAKTQKRQHDSDVTTKEAKVEESAGCDSVVATPAISSEDSGSDENGSTSGAEDCTSSDEEVSSASPAASSSSCSNTTVDTAATDNDSIGNKGNDSDSNKTDIASEAEAQTPSNEEDGQKGAGGRDTTVHVKKEVAAVSAADCEGNSVDGKE